MPATLLVLAAVVASIALGWLVTKGAIHLTLSLLHAQVNRAEASSEA
ncbi:MAG: hypothetical protein AAF533_17405 [Acidobacteriota bacterium]